MNDQYAQNQWIEQLYTDNFDLLYRLTNNRLRQYTGSSSDAQDVLQEIFLLACKNQQLLQNHENPTGWLIMTATNVCKNHVRAFQRKQKTWQRMAADLIVHQPQDIHLHYEGAQPDETAVSDIQATLEETLSPEDLALLKAYCIENHSLEEICEATGLSANTVRVRIHRIRKNISQFFVIFLVIITIYLNI